MLFIFFTNKDKKTDKYSGMLVHKIEFCKKQKIQEIENCESQSKGL